MPVIHTFRRLWQAALLFKEINKPCLQHSKTLVLKTMQKIKNSNRIGRQHLESAPLLQATQ